MAVNGVIRPTNPKGVARLQSYPNTDRSYVAFGESIIHARPMRSSTLMDDRIFKSAGFSVLKQFTIENFKSIEHMTLNFGRVNVLIGENGAGKSNILEAIALAGAARAGKLDNEFLASRGIRAVAPLLMRSAFEKDSRPVISLTAIGENNVKAIYNLTNDEKPYSSWSSEIRVDGGDGKLSDQISREVMEAELNKLEIDDRQRLIEELIKALESIEKRPEAKDSSRHSLQLDKKFFETVTAILPTPDDHLSDFIVYSPENSSLRLFEQEAQITPLGIRGEGLLKLLLVLETAEDKRPIEQIKSSLCMLGWFSDYKIVQDSAPHMAINDRFLAKGTLFDQRSANEGFLFLAFYFALFCSDLTPKLFAIDNVDASLNPKLCLEMIKRLVKMAKANDKQVILTTHNPAVLDGLDLNDDEQRLFVIERDDEGRTRAFRRMKPKYEGKPRKLSELFMAGAIGGLPTEF